MDRAHRWRHSLDLHASVVKILVRFTNHLLEEQPLRQHELENPGYDDGRDPQDDLHDNAEGLGGDMIQPPGRICPGWVRPFFSRTGMRNVASHRPVPVPGNSVTLNFVTR